MGIRGSVKKPGIKVRDFLRETPVKNYKSELGNRWSEERCWAVQIGKISNLDILITFIGTIVHLIEN